MTGESLRVAVATPLPEELCELIHQREPRIHLIRDASLLPTPRWLADFKGDPSFTRRPQQQRAFEEILNSADVLYGIPDMNPALLASTVRANPQLRWVQAMSAGAGADVKAAALTHDELERVIFTTSAGVHAGPLAEFAVFGLFAGAKNLPRLQEDQRARRWPGRWPMNQISEQTVLVMGLGSIGREVARKLAALGATVTGTSRRNITIPGVSAVIDPSNEQQMLETIARADAVVVTLPGTEATNKLLSAKLLTAAKPGLVVVSVGRGTVIDEEALIAGLGSGHIGFAALDVFASEPLSPDSPLWGMDNVIVSPHTAANSPHEERLIAELFADNARRFLDGEPLRNVVNTREFY